MAEAKEGDDPRKLGLAAFAEKKFRLAAENFGRAADAQKRRGADGFLKSAADRSLQGDSYSSAAEFAKALRAYKTALDDLNVYSKGRQDLNLPTYPEYVSDLRGLRLKAASVQVLLGSQLAGPESLRYQEDALRACREVVESTARASDPIGWASAQFSLGWASGDSEIARPVRKGSSSSRRR